jgi:predicted porin
VGGRYGNGLSWDFAVHSGLQMPTDGSSAFRVRSGRQKVAEALADDLAWTARVKYTGIPGLELSGTYHYEQDPSQLSRDGLDDGTLVSFHGIYNQGPFSVRALWAQWNFDGDLVELADADQQTGWYLEPSMRLNLMGRDVGFYTRYEDLEGARLVDRFDQWEVGVNYWPHPDVVLKADWRDREHDVASQSGSDFKGFDLGIGYQF